MEHSDDLHLLTRFHQDRDNEAFAELTQRYSAWVFGASLRVCRDYQLAEDATQECFLELARNPHRVNRSLSSWLHCVARRIAQRLRQRKPTTVSDPVAAKPDDPQTADLLRRLDEAIEAMPADLREILLCHYVESLTQEQMAMRFALSQATVSRRLEEARAELRRRLNQDDNRCLLALAALSVDPPATTGAKLRELPLPKLLPRRALLAGAALAALGGAAWGVSRLLGSPANEAPRTAAAVAPTPTPAALTVGRNDKREIAPQPTGPLPLFVGGEMKNWWIDPACPNGSMENGILTVHNPAGNGLALHAEIGGMSWDNYRIEGEFCPVTQTSQAHFDRGGWNWNIQFCPHDSKVFAQLYGADWYLGYLPYADSSFAHLGKGKLAAAPALNEWHKFAVTAKNEDVTMEYEGVEVCKAISPSGTRGMFGLIVNTNSDATLQLRNLTVTFLNPTAEQIAEYKRRSVENWKTWVDAQHALGRNVVDPKLWPSGKPDLTADAREF